MNEAVLGATAVGSALVGAAAASIKPGETTWLEFSKDPAEFCMSNICDNIQAYCNGEMSRDELKKEFEKKKIVWDKSKSLKLLLDTPDKVEEGKVIYRFIMNPSYFDMYARKSGDGFVCKMDIELALVDDKAYENDSYIGSRILSQPTSTRTLVINCEHDDKRWILKDNARDQLSLDNIIRYKNGDRY